MSIKYQGQLSCRYCQYFLYNFRYCLPIIMLTIWIIIAAALFATISIALLLRSSLSPQKKQKILVLMAILIFVSIVISNFKSRQIMQSITNLVSSGNNEYTRKINQIYQGQISLFTLSTGQSIKGLGPNYYIAKFQNIEKGEAGEKMIERNYGAISNKEHSQKIIYVSEKGEGASYFMYEITEKLRELEIPTFYIKLSTGGQQFLRKSGFNNFKAFLSSVNYFSEKGTMPYLIVDNAENLPLEFWVQITQFSRFNELNIILNTEHLHRLVQLLHEDQLAHEGQSIDEVILDFEHRNWIGPSQEVLRLLSPENSYVDPNKKKYLPVNFEIISQMLERNTQQEIMLRHNSILQTVAQHFGVHKTYGKIKRAIQSKGISIIKNGKQSGKGTQIQRSTVVGASYSSIRKLDIIQDQFRKLLDLNIIELSNGIVYLK